MKSTSANQGTATPQPQWEKAIYNVKLEIFFFFFLPAEYILFHRAAETWMLFCAEL